MRTFLGLFLTMTIFGVSAHAEDIFVVSDVYGIKPDGTCYETSGGDFGALKKKNVHWDAATRTIRLYGARNEEVAVQIVIPMRGKGFSARLEKLAGIPAENVTTSAVAYVRTKEGTPVPDLILPLDGSVKGIKSFNIPFDLQGLPNPKNRVGVMLMEVWIPKDAKPGLTRGALSILKGKESIATFNIELLVFDFALPDMPTYHLDLLSYSSPLSALGMDVRLEKADTDFTTPDEAIAAEHQVYKLTLDNRGFMNILPYHSQRGSPRYAYPVVGKGSSARIVSFKGFDERFGPVLDGKTNKYGQPPAVFTLAFNINYPYGMDSDPAKQFDFTPFKHTVPLGPGKNLRLKEYEETWRRVAQQYVEHFQARGWTKTIFEIYFNQKPNPDRNRTPWKLDEPTEGPEYKGLRYLMNVTKWAFSGAKQKDIKVITRIDIGHWECDAMQTPKGKPAPCYKAKRYNKDQARKYLQPVVDRWVAGVSHTEGAQHLISEYNTEDVLFEQYGTCGYTDQALATHYGDFAGIAWKHAFMGIEGRIFYKMGFGTDPNRLTTHCFLYTGQPIGFKGALASHRLKLWRNSVNDYDYIMLARKKDTAAADAILAKMVKEGLTALPKYRERSRSRGFWFTNNVEDITRARCALAEIITGRDYGIRPEGFSKKFTPCGSPDQIVGYD